LPDEQIIIRRIADDLGVSDSPVREALKRLMSEDFVVQRGNAIFAAPLSSQEFLDMLEVRLDLERIAIRKSAERINKEETEYLTSIIKEMKKTVGQKDMLAYRRLHNQFHIESLVYCGVSYLRSALIDAIDHHNRGMIFFKLTAWRSEPSIQMHEAILSALTNHDPNEAEKCLIQNRSKAFEYYHETLQARKNNQPVASLD